MSEGPKFLQLEEVGIILIIDFSQIPYKINFMNASF